MPKRKFQPGDHVAIDGGLMGEIVSAVESPSWWVKTYEGDTQVVKGSGIKLASAAEVADYLRGTGATVRDVAKRRGNIERPPTDIAGLTPSPTGYKAICQVCATTTDVPADNGVAAMVELDDDGWSVKNGDQLACPACS